MEISGKALDRFERKEGEKVGFYFDAIRKYSLMSRRYLFHRFSTVCRVAARVNILAEYRIAVNLERILALCS